MINPAGRAAIPPAMAAPPPPPPPSGAVDGLLVIDRVNVRLRCLEIARDIGARIVCDNCEHVITYPTTEPAHLIAAARQLEAYALGQDQEADRG